MKFVDLKREGYLFGQIPINLYKEIDAEIQENPPPQQEEQ
jgi:hypothetical protein